MKIRFRECAFCTAILILAAGLVHQRNAYLQVKKQRSEIKKERDQAREQLDVARGQLATAKAAEEQHAAAAEEGRVRRGSAVFQGAIAPDAYPAILARVRTVSPVPDPTTSPYKDCLAEIEIEPLAWGEQSAGKTRIGIIPIFRDRSLTREADLKTNDVIHCALVPEAHIGPELKKLRKVSAIEDLTLETVYLAGTTRVGSGKAQRFPILSNEHALPRSETITHDLKRIEALLSQHDYDWQAWHAATQPYRNQLQQMVDKAGGSITKDERFTFGNLAALSHQPGPTWPAPQLAMIQSMHKQLAARNIDLIVVPVPIKEVTTWPYLLEDHPSDGILMPYRLYMHYTLLQAGIEVVDLAPALIAAWQHHPHVFYDGLDTHPADGAIQVAADLVAQRLTRYPFTPLIDETWRLPFRFRIPQANPAFPASAYTSDRYTATRVLTSDYKGIRDASVRESPVLVVSDSFGGVPIDYGVRNANFLAHLSARIGIPMRHLQVGGGAPQMLKHMVREPEGLLHERQVCIFLFHENYLFGNPPDRKEWQWEDALLPAER